MATETHAGGPTTAPRHARPDRRRPWRRPAVVLGSALVLAGGAVGAFVLRAPEDDGASVVLLPASAPASGEWFGDLDLVPAEQREGSVDGASDPLPELEELDPPLALAGRTVRATEPLLYAGTVDAPTCDLEALLEGVEEGGTAGLGAWTGIVTGADAATGGSPAGSASGDEVDPEDAVAALTPVRLRVDTRVTAHRRAGDGAEPYPAVLQAGTAVLIDARGVPTVRCSGGLPLVGVDIESDGLDADAAFDTSARAADPDTAWGGFDPREVVVPVPGSSLDDVGLAEIAGGQAFNRPAGTNGDRDWREAQGLDEGCEGCPSLEVTAVSAAGTAVQIEAVAGGFPSVEGPDEIVWNQADPGTYGWELSHDYEMVGSQAYQSGDDLSGIPADGQPIDDPEVEGDDTFARHNTDGPFFVVETWQCRPGNVTVTVRVGGEVVATSEHSVPCGLEVTVPGEYVLAG